MSFFWVIQRKKLFAAPLFKQNVFLNKPTPMVLKLFWVATHLEDEFDSTAAHLELLHQTYSLCLPCFLKNLLKNIVTLNEPN